MRPSVRWPRGDDRGAALVAVLGVMMVFAIISVTLVSTVVFASSTSSATRAGVQAQNSAEQAIDGVISQLSSVPRTALAAFPCNPEQTTTTDAGLVHVDVEVLYRSGGGAYVCPPVGEPNDVKLIARSVVTINTGNGQDEVRRVVQQDLEVEPAGSSSALFGHGVFSNANLYTTNSFTVFNGGVYTNGTFRCDSGAYVEGDVVAAGTGATNFSNTCQVGGNVVVGGAITSGGWGVGPRLPYSVGGDLISATGHISLGGGTRIGGSAQAATTVRVDTHPVVPASPPHVAGAVRENTPSEPPSAVVMPVITWSDLNPPGSPLAIDYRQWLQENAIANGAPNWTAPYLGTGCTAAGPNWSMNGPLRGPAAAAIVDARGCSEAMLQDIDLILNDDLTLVVNSFDSTNGLRVISHKVGSNAKLRIVVPLPAGAAACSGVGTGSIGFRAGGANLGSNVDVFLYTNGTVTMTNGVTMNGSVYGCQTSFSNDTSITYTDMTPPGMESPASEFYVFTTVARFDRNAND